MRSLIAAFLLAGLCLSPAAASPLTYRVDFTGESIMGAPLPFGSFVYDPDVGFSNFIVYWNGVAFDMTSSASAPELAADPPTGCASAASNHQYGFIFMSQTAAGCTAPPQYGWSGLYNGGSAAQFVLTLTVTNDIVPATDVHGMIAPTVAQDLIGAAVGSDVPPYPPMDFGMGGWSVSQTPEPSTLAMSLAAALSLAGIKLARRSGRSK